MNQDVTLESLLAVRPLGRLQIFVAVLCGVALLLDGLNTQLIGYAAPAIARGLHLDHEQTGLVFGAGLFGLLLGGLVCSPLADMLGRRLLLCLSVLAFGIFTSLGGAAADLPQLAGLRFLAGLGMGGAMPIAIALTAEFAPRRVRARMIMIMFCGFPLGSALAGLYTAAILPAFGWRVLFLAAGALAVLFALVLFACLPESPVFLIHRRAAPHRIRALIARLAPGAENMTFTSPPPRQRALPVIVLFQDKRALATTLIWIVYFMSLLDIYFLASWLPTVLNAGGKSLQSSVIGTSMLQFGGVAGTLILGRWLDRGRLSALLAASYLLSAFAIAAIGVAGTDMALLAVAFLAGFFLIGAQSGLSVLASHLYPTEARATGIGWGLSVGRVGSIVGPTVGSVLIATHWSMSSLFLAVAAPAFIAAIAVWLMGVDGGQHRPDDLPLPLASAP